MVTPKLFSLAVLAASALALSTPAMADWKTKEVKHDDLDLSTIAGKERLMTRVKSAVKQVCGSPRAITINERLDERKCKQAAMASAMPKAEQTVAAYLETRRIASRDTKAVAGN